MALLFPNHHARKGPIASAVAGWWSRGFALALVLVATVGATASGWAEPVVRSHSVIDRAVIQLGDLFVGIDDPSIATLPVMNAPAPGQRAQFDQPSLAALARDNGLAWTPTGRGERAVVERAGRVIERGVLVQALSLALQAQGAGPAPGAAVEYAFEGEEPKVAVAPNEPPSVRVDQLSFEPRSQRFVALVTAPATGAAQSQTRVAGRLVPAVEVAMMNRDLQPGEVIRARDVELRRVRADRVNSSVVTSADRLIGRTVKRPILAQQLVRASDVVATLMVTKNNQVHVQLKSNTMVLMLQAKALEDGAEGDTIKVLNQQSNRTIQGVVTGPGEVTINAGNAFAAN